MKSSRKSKLLSIVASLISVLPLCTASIFAQTPAFTSFDAPDAGTGIGQGTLPIAINQKGVIAGTYYDSSNNGHGFLRQANGQITEFSPTNLTNVGVWALNNPGQVVGSGVLTVKPFYNVGFQRSVAGQIKIFAPAGAIFTIPLGINDSGTSTGVYQDTANAWHGFLRDASGTITIVDDPDANISNGNGTDPTAINNNGAITGYYNGKNTGTVRAFIRDQFGNFSNFDVAPGGQTVVDPMAINLSGEVAGWYTGSDQSVAFGFLQDASGNVTDFSVPHATDFRTEGMNDNGVTVGFWQPDNGGADFGFERSAAGTITSFTVPFPNFGTDAVGINNNGRVAGYWPDTNFLYHGFVR
jgi:hypothetical protein